MDLSLRALQTNGNLFFKFQISFRIIGRKPKKNIQTNSEAWIFIKVQSIIATSMDLSWQVLQTNGNVFPNFKLVFELLVENLKKKYSD